MSLRKLLNDFLGTFFWSSYGPDLFYNLYSRIEKSEVFLNYCESLYKERCCTFNMLSFEQREFFIKKLKERGHFVGLEMGHGPGGMALKVARMNECLKLIAVDYSEFTPSSSCEKAHFFKYDLGHMDIEKSQFDIVYCIDSLYHIQKRKKLLNKVINSLKEKGEFILFHSFTSIADKESFFIDISQYNVEIVEFSDDDYSYWLENKKIIESMKLDFFNEDLEEIYSMREKEINKFLYAHHQKRATRFCFIFKP